MSNKCYNDALHIALATLHGAAILASWNFKHIVNLDRIKLYNSMNSRMGYRLREIRPPREILKPNDHEKRKKYDAVAEVRKIREALSLKYWGHPDLLLKDLKEAREKFHLEQKTLKRH